MSDAWVEMPADVRALAEETLTPLQLEAWKLRQGGYSWRTIAVIQGMSRQTVRERVAAADRRLFKAGLRQNAYGRFSIEDAA